MGYRYQQSHLCAKRVIETIIKTPTAHCNTPFHVTVRGFEKAGQHAKGPCSFSDSGVCCRPLSSHLFWTLVHCKYTHTAHAVCQKKNRSCIVETTHASKSFSIKVVVVWTSSRESVTAKGCRRRKPPLPLLSLLRHACRRAGDGIWNISEAVSSLSDAWGILDGYDGVLNLW